MGNVLVLCPQLRCADRQGVDALHIRVHAYVPKRGRAAAEPGWRVRIRAVMSQYTCSCSGLGKGRPAAACPACPWPYCSRHTERICSRAWPVCRGSSRLGWLAARQVAGWLAPTQPAHDSALPRLGEVIVTSVDAVAVGALGRVAVAGHAVWDLALEALLADLRRGGSTRAALLRARF